jgi:3-methyladenine DNA glycosylase AlkC
MAALKDEISAELAAHLASEISAAWPAFPTGQFGRDLDDALAPLELMARVDLLTERLVDTLPGDFETAAKVLWGTLESAGFTGWMTLPCGNYVARAGVDRPAVALPLLAGLTPRWSCEGPIRPFIERHPSLTYEHLRRWVSDPDEHVRRLVSEGTRPRLPWAPRLRQLIADPSPNIELLDRLVEDPSPYVRRSVANHLNDIAKDHPNLTLDLANRWLPRGDGAAWAVRRGLRTLVKQGDPRALAILGVATDADVRLSALTVDRDTVTIGDAVTFASPSSSTAQSKPMRSSTTASTTWAPPAADPRSSSSPAAAWHPANQPPSPDSTASSTFPFVASPSATTPSTSSSTAASSAAFRSTSSTPRQPSTDHARGCGSGA